MLITLNTSPKEARIEKARAPKQRDRVGGPKALQDSNAVREQLGNLHLHREERSVARRGPPPRAARIRTDTLTEIIDNRRSLARTPMMRLRTTSDAGTSAPPTLLPVSERHGRGGRDWQCRRRHSRSCPARQS
ncbi:hypothetical protein L1887_48196 [Cichorium endivia]|nr:hypothetical protein L1887_48196 [Cichorium endivia]